MHYKVSLKTKQNTIECSSVLNSVLKKHHLNVKGQVITYCEKNSGNVFAITYGSELQRSQ
jgi:hypothetical protein